MNLKLNLFKNSLSISLLCSPKLLYFLNGSGIEVKGLPKFSFKTLSFGIFSGTFLNPSISSEKVINSCSIFWIWFSALIIIEVLATSPKVPICGKPLGP